MSGSSSLLAKGEQMALQLRLDRIESSLASIRSTQELQWQLLESLCNMHRLSIAKSTASAALACAIASKVHSDARAELVEAFTQRMSEIEPIDESPLLKEYLGDAMRETLDAISREAQSWN